MEMSGGEPVLEIRGLTKRFTGTLALDHVDLSVRRGEVQALIGENGAGKSTLIKALAGLFAPDTGEIRFEGAVRHPHIEHLPISFVHQDLGLVDELSIGENVALVAGYPRQNGLIDWRGVWTRARDIYHAMDVEAPDARFRVGTLDAAGKAVLGIVRALAHKTSILVLDEPTASLPEPDAQHLFTVLRKLRAAGTGVIYVSHRLNELFGLVDRVTVLRDGRRVRTADIAEVTPESLVADMLGRAVDFSHPTGERQRGTPILEVNGLCTGAQGPLSFEVDSGEIVALVGLRGAGQDTVGRAIFGAVRTRAGEVRLKGRQLPASDGIADRIAAGVALLPGDRVRESAFAGMSLRENLFPYPGITDGGIWSPYSPSEERARTQSHLQRFDVRPSNGEAMIDWLSGGNQQKVFVARWLESKAPLLILEEPTAGVDIGAKLAIHGMVRDAAKAGAAVLVVSSDFEEVAALCDRALVLGRGRIIGELSGTALTMDSLLACSSSGAQTGATA
jgi:ribose transport system ATP-binding protein